MEVQINSPTDDETLKIVENYQLKPRINTDQESIA